MLNVSPRVHSPEPMPDHKAALTCAEAAWEAAMAPGCSERWRIETPVPTKDIQMEVVGAELRRESRVFGHGKEHWVGFSTQSPVGTVSTT